MTTITPHHGGPNPAPGRRVRVQFRKAPPPLSGEISFTSFRADSFSWNHTGSGGDIIGYIIVPD